MIKIFKKQKDGGKDSPVDGYFLIEWKGLFSIALLKFNKGQREAFHTHAFDAYTWFLFGDMEEERLYYYKNQIDEKNLDIVGKEDKKYKFSFIPKFTSKDNLHRVTAKKTSWCFTLRGRWDKTWIEVDKVNTEKNEKYSQLRLYTDGRKVLEKSRAYWKL